MFLYFSPNLEEKSRRKKERSSIFSRKKKDKSGDKSKKSLSNNSATNNQGPPTIGHPLFDPPQLTGNGSLIDQDSVGSTGQKSLAKVSSSIQLGGRNLNTSNQVSSGSSMRGTGGSSGSSSLSHHYSMSSLRKSSVSGPLQTHSTSMLGANTYLNGVSNSSNFYVARGEIR